MRPERYRPTSAAPLVPMAAIDLLELVRPEAFASQVSLQQVSLFVVPVWAVPVWMAIPM